MPGALGTVYGTVRMNIGQAVASYAALRAQNTKLVYALRGTSESFISSGRSMVAAGAGLTYMFGKAVSAAAEFQRRMDFFGAVTNANAKQMRQLSKFTLQMGTDTIYSVNEIADGFIELGKAGITAQDIMDGIGRSMVNLGAAADIPLAESGQIITSTLKTWDLEAKRATYVVNQLQGAANATIADVSDIGVSLKYVGGIAATTGVSLSSTIDAISLLAQAGIRGSTAGTSLRQMLVSLGGATGPATEELQKLGIITKDGTNLFYTQAGAIKPLAQVFQILQDHTDKLSQKTRLAALRTIFNNRALAAASILSRAGAKGFREMHKEVGKTTAEEIMHKRLDNLSGDIKILKANIQSMLVKAGSPFQEQMRTWVQQLTKLIQAFGKLDPKTQKMIVQFIGIAGVSLLAMGAFNILIGTVLKFIASMIKMGAGVKFLFSILKILIFNLRWLIVLFGGELVAAIGAASVTVIAIVAAILLVVAALVVLYIKWKPFRELVNNFAKAIWDAIKAIGSFLKLLATDPGAAWGKIKDLAASVRDAVINAFKSLGNVVWNGLKGAGSAVGQFILSVIHWFAQLPGKVVGLVVKFVSKVLSLMTFRNLGYVIGFVIGTVIRLWYLFMTKSLQIIGKLVSGVLGWFRTLPGKIGHAIGFLIGRSIRLWIQWQMKLVRITAQIINGVAKFFAKLPGRVGRFIVNTVNRGIHLWQSFMSKSLSLIGHLITGTIKFFQELPGKIPGIMSRMRSGAIRIIQDLKTKAVNFAKGLARGFYVALQNLPGAVAGILDQVISAFKGVIKEGFEAAKSFAKGLWDGFKDGLGIHSPSHIERAMWQITGVLDKETKKIAKHTMKVQKLSRQMADTQFGVGGDPYGVSARRSLVGLASMHSRNQKRAGKLAGSSGKRRAYRSNVQSGSGDKRYEMRIENWHEGRGHMREIAEDAIEDQDSFESTVNGMGGY